MGTASPSPRSQHCQTQGGEANRPHQRSSPLSGIIPSAGADARTQLLFPSKKQQQKSAQGWKLHRWNLPHPARAALSSPGELPGLGQAPARPQAAWEHPRAPAALRGPLPHLLSGEWEESQLLAHGGERRAALYSPAPAGISVCPAQVIPTTKILLPTPFHPPRWAGKLPRSPLCLYSTFLQKRQEEPLLVSQ